MSRQTDDGEHEGYLAVELTGPWPDGYARFDESTGTWWTASSNTRPAVTGRYRARCDRHDYGDESGYPAPWRPPAIEVAHWAGPILELPYNEYGDVETHVEDAMLTAWQVHVRCAASSSCDDSEAFLKSAV